MRGECSRPAHYFTSSEWVNRKEIVLGGWPSNRKAPKSGRQQAGALAKAKGFIKKMEAQGLL